jgi:hypothetical protein
MAIETLNTSHLDAVREMLREAAVRYAEHPLAEDSRLWAGFQVLTLGDTGTQMIFYPTGALWAVHGGESDAD